MNVELKGIFNFEENNHSKVDGDPTVAGAKTNTTALELAIS